MIGDIRDLPFIPKMILAAISMLLLSFIALGVVSLVSCGSDYSNGKPVSSTETYFKDVDCTITNIEAKWVITQWIVDIEFENAEYGLSGRQHLTTGDAMKFHDAEVGEHIAVEMFSTVRTSDGEVINRRLSKIVVSAGHDPISVELR